MTDKVDINQNDSGGLVEEIMNILHYCKTDKDLHLKIDVVAFKTILKQMFNEKSLSGEKDNSRQKTIESVKNYLDKRIDDLHKHAEDNEFVEGKVLAWLEIKRFIEKKEG